MTFKLWAMLEVTDDELALIERYDIDKSVVLDGNDEGLWKKSVFIGIPAAIFALLVAKFSGVSSNYYIYDFGSEWFFAMLVGIGAAYWWVNEKRETIYMKDLLHGRRFKCKSIIELAKKEAWLENACQALRQVVESARHWDGVEHRDVPVLPPEEAKAFIVRAFP